MRRSSSVGNMTVKRKAPLSQRVSSRSRGHSSDDMELRGRRLYEFVPFYRDIAFICCHPEMQRILSKYDNDDSESLVLLRCIQTFRRLQTKCGESLSPFALLTLLDSGIKDGNTRRRILGLAARETIDNDVKQLVSLMGNKEDTKVEQNEQ
jgi:hypothetical protein